MAPTKSELWTQLAKAIKILDQTYQFGGVSATNLKGLIEALQDVYEGNHIASTQAAVTALRSAYSGILANARNVVSPLILELAKIGYSSIATDAAYALDDIAFGMDAATETISERDWTFGAIAATVGNTGTGTVYRCYTEKYGNVIEAGLPVQNTLTAKCTADRANGKTLGTEDFTLYSGPGKIDEIDLGSYPTGSQVVASKRAVDGLLSNPSFETYSGSGATLAVTGWTLNDNTKLAAETGTYFRKAPGSTSGVSLKFTDNTYISQYLGSTSIDSSKPLFVIVRLYRQSSCDGTVTLTVGSKSETVTLSAQSGWFDLVFGVTDSDGWYDNFKSDGSGLGVVVKIDLASRTTGTLLVDEIVCAQPTVWNGIYWLVAAGATDWLKDDSFTWVDAVDNDGKIQYWIARIFGKSLPHTSGTPTYADA